MLGHGRWFSPVTPASSTTKTGRHDIVEILLKVALNTINQINSKSNLILEFFCFTDQYFEYLDCDFFVLFVIFNFLFHQCCFLFPIIDIYFYLAVNSKLVFQTFKFNLPFNISTCRMVWCLLQSAVKQMRQELMMVFEQDGPCKHVDLRFIWDLNIFTNNYIKDKRYEKLYSRQCKRFSIIPYIFYIFVFLSVTTWQN